MGTEAWRALRCPHSRLGYRPDGHCPGPQGHDCSGWERAPCFFLLLFIYLGLFISSLRE